MFVGLISGVSNCRRERPKYRQFGRILSHLPRMANTDVAVYDA